MVNCFRLPARNGRLAEAIAATFAGQYPATGDPSVVKEKLSNSGGSQAVRLPSEYRFEGAEVFIRRDPLTEDVVLSSRPHGWKEFFALANRIVPADFNQ